MDFRIKKLVFLFLPLLAAVSACAQAGSAGLALNNLAPDFKLTSLSGQSVSLSAQSGKTVVINFWQTTCPPCRAEMPYFQAAYEAWKARGVVLLSLDIGEGAGVVSGFLSDLGLTFPVLLDSQAEVAGKYGIQYTPTTLFIDSQGRLKSKVVGAFKDQNAIENQLKSLQN